MRTIRRHRSARRIGAFLALIVAIVVAGSRPMTGASQKAPVKHSKLDRQLQQAKANPSAHVRVIVRTAKGKRDEVSDRLERKGGWKAGDLDSIGGFVADISGSSLADLEQDSDVLGVSTDAVVQNFASQLDLAGTAAALTEVLGVDGSPWSGDKVGIAVVDSGLVRGHDLDGGRTDKFFDLSANGADKAYDDYGHGTHVAGLIGGTGKQSTIKQAQRDNKGNVKVQDVPFYEGVAPRARILAFKVLDENGAGYTSQVIQALDFIVENKDRLKIDIVNLSLGHPILEPATTDPLVLAVERAVRAGLVVVAAAGNYGRSPVTGDIGYAGVTSPGNAPSAITVGAYDAHGTVSRFDDTIPAYLVARTDVVRRVCQA